MKSIAHTHQTQAKTPGIAAGLRLLLQSRRLAKEAERDIWEFAVEKEILHSAGTNNSDLRWMICHGIIEHAYELEQTGGPTREFCVEAELAFDGRSCFVLTDDGERLAVESADRMPAANSNGTARIGLVNGASTRSAATETMTPTWDSPRHQLRIGGLIVKEYKLPSPNQETILAAFEEERWPPRIDDPLPVHPDLDPKRRLHDTIKSLNRNQRVRKIRFMGDGTGEGVRWEWILDEA